jgi:hypothetical protein
MAGQKPFLTDDLVKIRLEHRVACVKFLIKAVPDLRLCGELLHDIM